MEQYKFQHCFPSALLIKNTHGLIIINKNKQGHKARQIPQPTPMGGRFNFINSKYYQQCNKHKYKKVYGEYSVVYVVNFFFSEVEDIQQQGKQRQGNK